MAHCIVLFYSSMCVWVNFHVNIFFVNIYTRICCPIKDFIFIFSASVASRVAECEIY